MVSLKALKFKQDEKDCYDKQERKNYDDCDKDQFVELFNFCQLLFFFSFYSELCHELLIRGIELIKGIPKNDSVFVECRRSNV